jgi:uracil-DNA glycosylase
MPKPPKKPGALPGDEPRRRATPKKKARVLPTGGGTVTIAAPSASTAQPKAAKSPAESASAAFVPANPTLPRLKEAAAGCTACDLYKTGTQTVFGDGLPRARLMFIGEQPGDKEDLAGQPFVGPAGTLLDQALEAAGIDRSQVYVTNTVKHFKWKPQGKRRIHQKPNAREIAACRGWLEAELDVIRPKVIVCLGATAAQALLGKSFRVTERRGEVIPGTAAPNIMATVHPSSILRAPDEETRHRETELFIRDLSNVAPLLKG